MYISLDYYQSLYGEIPEADFKNLSWEACRKLDVLTTGVDGVRKLKVAFPTDEEDAESVKRCACAVLNMLYQLKQAEDTAKTASGFIETANGLQGKIISSVSAGNESISYATGSTFDTLYSQAASDKTVQDQLLSDTIHEYLSGIPDANGVNLLYMGPYPCRLEKQ